VGAETSSQILNVPFADLLDRAASATNTSSSSSSSDGTGLTGAFGLTSAPAPKALTHPAGLAPHQVPLDADTFAVALNHVASMSPLAANMLSHEPTTTTVGAATTTTAAAQQSQQLQTQAMSQFTDCLQEAKQAIAESQVIDELCDIFKTKAQCSEMRTLQNKILDACQSGNKEAVMDLVDICKEKKRMYLVSI
jgi:hypothetical protein